MTGRSAFLFLIGSARRDGNTELLARAAEAGITTDHSQRWLRLTELPLPAFEDRRHDPAGYGPVDGNALLLLEATLVATEIVFVAPTYWYSLPAVSKLYLDHWSHWMRLADVAFKGRMAGKVLSLVTVCSNAPGDDEGTQPAVETLRRSADYLSMRWRGTLIGHANQPGTIRDDSAALAAAATFFTSLRPAEPAAN